MGICSSSKKEKEIPIEIKMKDGELDIKSDSFEDTKQIINDNNTFKDEKLPDEFKKPELEKFFIINIGEKYEIITIYKLPNKRVSILTKDEKEKIIFIYSIITGELITKIHLNKNDEIENVIGLKNNDLVIYNEHKIYIYNLINDNYILNQTINEYEQGTNLKVINQKLFGNKTEISKEGTYRINSIYELNNGNLVSCNVYGIKLYHKENGLYKLLYMKEIKDEVENVIELNNNKLIIFYVNHFFMGTSLDNFRFEIYEFDLEKKDLICLRTLITGIRYDNIYWINYLISGNYLFLRYGDTLEVYDISKDFKLINGGYKFIGACNGDYDIISIDEFVCNYEGNFFVVKNRKDKLKIVKFENNTFKFYGDYPFVDYKKLEDNIFANFSGHELILFKKIN